MDQRRPSDCVGESNALLGFWLQLKHRRLELAHACLDANRLRQPDKTGSNERQLLLARDLQTTLQDKRAKHLFGALVVRQKDTRELAFALAASAASTPATHGIGASARREQIISHV